MSNHVYFGNSVADTVSVNINESLQNLVLAPRATIKNGDLVTAINCPAVQCLTGPNKDKGKFGTGGGDSNTNLIKIQFDSLEAGEQSYHVTTENLSGRNLYIYIFDGALVGQDETGRALNIDIVKLEG